MAWDRFLSCLMWYCGSCLLATIVLLSFINNPKYMIYIYYRLQYLKLGLRKKAVLLTSTFSFSYFERRSEDSNVTVLLVHGFSATKEQYLALMKYLPQRVHIIAVDIFGHGETSLDGKEVFSVENYVAYLKEFVDLVGLSKSKFHIVGYSLGGFIAGIYGVNYPDDLVSLTMICPAGVSFEKEDAMIEEAKRTKSYILLPKTIDELRELFRVMTYGQSKLPSWVLSALLQIRLEKEEFYTQALYALVDPHSHHLLEKNLSILNVPSFVIWGIEDKIIPIECLEIIKKCLPTPPKVAVIEKAGHGLLLERPRKIAFLLMEFFNNFE